MATKLLLAALCLAGAAAAAEEPVPPAAAPSTTKAAPANAAEEEVNLDEVKPEAPKPVISIGDSHLGASLMGRFSLDYEWRNPGMSYPTGENVLTSYHHFVFVKANAGDVSFFGEITQQLFWAGTIKVRPDLSLSFGKILVPFGAPGFHHWYGGVQGDPLAGIFVPVIWAELGGSAEWTGPRRGDFSLDATVFAVRAFGPGPDGTPNTQNPAAGDDRFALGARVALGYGRIHGWLSGYGTKWAPANGLMTMFGGDLSTEFGLIQAPVLRDLRVLAGVARLQWRTPIADDQYRYGDYLQLEYRSPYQAVARLRYGSYIHDAKIHEERDLHNWNLGATYPLGRGMSVMAEYQWNLEQKQEVNNDLLRVELLVEF